MANALKEGGCSLDQLGYINAHATGTSVGDAAEAIAIDRLLGESSLRELFESSTQIYCQENKEIKWQCPPRRGPLGIYSVQQVH